MLCENRLVTSDLHSFAGSKNESANTRFHSGFFKRVLWRRGNANNGFIVCLRADSMLVLLRAGAVKLTMHICPTPLNVRRASAALRNLKLINTCFSTSSLWVITQTARMDEHQPSQLETSNISGSFIPLHLPAYQPSLLLIIITTKIYFAQ